MSRSICPPELKEWAHMKASFSNLDRGRACPHLWMHTYKSRITGNPADKLAEQVSVQRDFGRLGHLAISNYITHCMTTGKTSDPANASVAWKRAVLGLMPPDEVLHPDLHQPDRDPEAVFSNFVASNEFKVLEPGEDWGVERVLWMPWTTKGGIHVAMEMRLDQFRVTGAYATIRDWKMSWQVMDTESFEQREVQLLIYFLGIMHHFPKVRHGNVARYYVPVLHDQEKQVTAEGLQRAIAFIDLTAEMIWSGVERAKHTDMSDEALTDIFPPHPGKPCEPWSGVICPAASVCKHVPNSGPLVLNSPDKAREVFGEYLVGQSQQKCRKGAVSDYAAVNGAVTCNGKQLRHKLVDSVVIPDRNAAVIYLYDNGKLADLQPVAASLRSHGEATVLAKELRDEGLCQIEQTPEERIENS